MRINILIPHWRTGKMTAYAIAQLLRFEGRHDLRIIIIDNSPEDGSLAYLEPFKGRFVTVPYLSNKISSHGIALDYAIELGYLDSEYFITMETDSFPTQEGWLNYYENLIDEGVEYAGSLLKLSGGEYIHPCGMMVKASIWHEAKRYCDEMQYHYFPNMSMKNGFASHLMVHYSILEKFIENPDDYIELSNSYKPYTKELALEKLRYYSPVANGPFHNGMGSNDENVNSYGLRTIQSEIPFVFLDNKKKLIHRVGAEPGQWLSWFVAASKKRIATIPTTTKWIDGKIGQQQEYTINEVGFTHLWGISAYKDVDPNDPIAKIKQALPEQLYNSLPEHQKIKE